MKIAYFGSDLYLNCLEVLESRHDEVIVIFVAANDSSNKKIIDYAIQNNIDYIIGKPTQSQIKKLESQQVECFISIEYRYLIPLPTSNVYTLNMHPTLLPEGRGATPLNYLILKYPEYAGVTFHQLASNFDEGKIVFQESMLLDANETLESMFVKLNLKIPPMLNYILDHLPALSANAKPQGLGSYWPMIKNHDRLVNWHDDVNTINTMVRAFGRFGVYVCLENKAYLVNHVESVVMSHQYALGRLITNDEKIFTVAIKDGMAIIYKNSILECVDITLDD